MMNLSTVSNNKYFISSINLIESYLKRIPTGNINYYYFDMDDSNLNLIKNVYTDKIKLIEVEKVVEYAWEPGMFFYKVWSLLHSIKNNDSFLYLDSGSEIIGDLSELQFFLKQQTRVFVRQLQRDRRNIQWTTKACFEAMKMDEERYYNSPHYHANIQAYLKTEENIKFVTEMYTYMLDKKVSGPNNKLSYPEKNNHICKAHRSDQSVLSILIEHYNWHQKHPSETVHKYSGLYLNTKDKVVHCHRIQNRTTQIRFSVLSKLLLNNLFKYNLKILILLPVVNPLACKPSRSYEVFYKLEKTLKDIKARNKFSNLHMFVNKKDQLS